MRGHMNKEFAEHWTKIEKERLDEPCEPDKSGEFKIQLDAGRAIIMSVRPNPKKALHLSDASRPIR